MKKFILASALAIVGSSAIAQSPEDLRVYINPGHGSWTGNDRPNQVIGKPVYSSTNTDTTGFFESNTDLWKGFGMLETLIDMGMPFDRTLNQTGERWKIGAAKDLSQNIVMSRVKNGPFEANNTKDSPNYMQYNRSLPEIAAEVEYNEFDIFVSIHSNAATEGSSTNYHLFMYRGKNGKQNVAVQGSWEMIEAAAKYSFPNVHSSWSHSNVYINGDVDFMGSGSGSTNSLGYYGYLGVMKHGCPGYLVEGYFHTYQPGRHRGMNPDVDWEEGAAYARGVAEYFEFDRTKTGDIFGVVRDQHEKFTHALYKPRASSNDVYKPLNGVKVNLLKDGQKIQEYTTDNFYNGAYLFFGLEPGEYTVTFEHPDYKNAEPQTITVVPGDCVYPLSWLENKEWIQPDDLKFTYPDELGDNTAYGASDEYHFNQTYVDAEISELAGKTIRRTVVKGDKLYVLALDEAKAPTLVVYDLAAKKVLANVATTGMKGNQLACSDIQLTADGVLVACNSEKLQFSDDYIQEGDTGRGTLRFYRWENDVNGVPQGEPIEFITTQNSSLWFRTYAGNTFAYEGTLEEGTITVGNPSITGPSYSLRTLEITVADGKSGSESVHKPMAFGNASANLTEPNLGEGYRFIPSPLDNRKVWIVSSKGGIVEIDNNTTDQAAAATNATKHTALANASGVNAFKYAGHSYLVAPVTTADGHVGITMYDVTAGLDKATDVTTVGTDIAAAQVAGVGAAGVTVVTRDASTNAVTNAYINLTAVRDNKVSRFSTQSVAQPVSPAAYAYDLTSKGVDNEYTLGFNLSNDAKNVDVVLIPVDGTENVVKTLGALEKGAQTVAVNTADLDENKDYNWEVRVEGKSVAFSGNFFTADANLKANSRGGLAWISDPESANFGKLITSAGYKQGINVYNPDMTKANDAALQPEGNAWVASKVYSPYRMGQLDGNVYLTDWSDAGAGYWFFDASNPATTFDALGGTRENTGAHTLDGVNLGGGSTGVAFQKQGATTYMYTFSEDWPAGNGTMTLARTAIGDTPWTTAPTAFGNVTGKNLMTGTNVEIVAIPDGIFVSQARAVGNNIEAGPSFVYLDNAGNVKFNSASLGDYLTSGGSGIALTSDLKVMAIAEAKSGIGIWDVEWNDNTPKLTKRYVIPGSEGTDEVNQLAFDAAGNLYAWHRSNYGLKAYTVKNATPVATTPAAKALVIKGNGAGVSDITVDNADNSNAPVEYFDLRGARISNPTPGQLVIRRQGTDVTKVIVK